MTGRANVAHLFSGRFRRRPRMTALAVVGVLTVAFANAWPLAAAEIAESNDGEKRYTFSLRVVGPDGAHVSSAQVEFRSPKLTDEHIHSGEIIRRHRYGVVLKATDDGAIQPYTVTWSVVEQPSDADPAIPSAAIADPTALQTTVTVSAEGIYVLQLEANDGEYTSSDTMTINVHPDDWTG